MSAQPDGLEARIGRLEDAAEIRELPERYAQAYGSLDLDTLTGLYVEDVQVGADERGRDRLRERFRAGSTGDRGVRLAVLHIGSHVIELPDSTDTEAGEPPATAVTATGRVLCHGEVERADGSWFHQAIHYGDRYVRTEDGWRFARQRRHELVYGVEPRDRPNELAPARWPEHDVGRGTVPDRWPSWTEFWARTRRSG